MDIESCLQEFHWDNPNDDLIKRITRSMQSPAVPTDKGFFWLYSAVATVLLAMGSDICTWMK